MTAPALVSLDDVRAARERIWPHLRETPVEEGHALSRLAGRRLLLKPEQRQRTGSFKFRGALEFVSHLEPGVDVVAASAGNHAQGVALASTLHGHRATIFMPSDAALPKVAATRDYGAEVVAVEGGVDDCIAAAADAASEVGAVFVPPFAHPWVIAGQGTVGLEIADEAPGIETVVVPVGGGGLVAGIGAALARVRPDVHVVGVEAAGAAKLRASLAAGRPVTLDRVETFADGIALRSASEITLAHVDAFVDEVVTVTDEEMAIAIVALAERAKAVVEPAGAAAVAAVIAGKVTGDPVLAVVSGGNVDPLLLGRVLTHGMAAAGRFLAIEVVLPDRPGSLAGLAREVAQLRANVLYVSHRRVGVDVGVDSVAVELHLETRDDDHADAVVAALARSGFEVRGRR
ncbi:MAG: threonine ammonia-lyase [Acidimicrobiia bacterium]|nr:threonine ammonia-lyase [Acidimicrobiia bacterium]